MEMKEKQRDKTKQKQPDTDIENQLIPILPLVPFDTSFKLNNFCCFFISKEWCPG